MTRWIVAILAAATLGLGLSFPVSASALVLSNLPQGVTDAQAVEAVAAGTYTPGEAMVAAQNVYLFQREAGATDAQAIDAANLVVPPEDYVGASGTVRDLWTGVESLPAMGAEAEASAGQLLDAATSALGDEGTDAALGGLCVETAGYGCAAAVVVGLGALAYTVLNGSGPSGPPPGGCDGGYCDNATEYAVKGLVRSWITDDNVSSNSGCHGGGSSWVDWAVGSSYQFPCATDGANDGGVFLLQITATSNDGSTTKTQPEWVQLSPGWPSWTFNGGAGCGAQADWGMHAGAILASDPMLPKATLTGVNSWAPNGWTDWYRSDNTCVDYYGNTYDFKEGIFVQPPGAVPFSFPVPNGCQGISCSNVTPAPVTPTLPQLATDLGSPNHAQAEQLLTSLAGGTDSSGNPVIAPGSAVVPSCDGLSFSGCANAYATAGFSGTVTSTTGSCAEQNSTYGPGDVVSQAPTNGSYADLTSNLAVILNPSPACANPVTVPDCSGLTVAACQQEFSQAGFTSTPTITWADGGPTSTPRGDVISTTPEYGTAGLPPNTSVSIDGAGLVIPTPAPDEVWSNYQADLANAGITNVQWETLSTQDAWLDGPPGAVTVITPQPNEVLNPDNSQAVTVDRNPDAMPVVPQDVSELALYLEDNDPGVTAENDLDIAEECLNAAQASLSALGALDPIGAAEEECRDRPLFVSAGDVHQAALHDAIAVGLPTIGLANLPTNGNVDPSWVFLNRYTNPSGTIGKRPGARWYKKAGEACYNPPTHSADSCDEYPFWSTIQGGDTASLAYINARQNSLQGTRLGQFYGSNTNPSVGGLVGCGIGPGKPFIAIPLAYAPASVPTTWACNSSASR